MTTLARPLAQSVSFTESDLCVALVDGRTLTVPLVWFPRLLSASEQARERVELLGEGEGIHWPEVDEDLSIAGLLAGSLGAGNDRRGSA
jgi:hypothetical protein